MTPNDVNVIVSKRSYEFRPDDIRLSILSLANVQDYLRQTFQFSEAALGSPPPTFGAVTPSFPPGLIFNFGAWTDDEGQVTPIRFLYIETQRIVIEVSGTSEIIDAVFRRLQEAIGAIEETTHRSALGEPLMVRDYSEIVLSLAFPPHAIFNEAIVPLLSRAATMQDTREENMAVVPIINVQLQAPNRPYIGNSFPSPTMVQLVLRVGTPPEEQIYYSAAPLDSSAHLAYLTDLQNVLSPALALPAPDA